MPPENVAGPPFSPGTGPNIVLASSAGSVVFIVFTMLPLLKIEAIWPLSYALLLPVSSQPVAPTGTTLYLE